MKQSEVKLKLLNYVNSLVDRYFDTNSFQDKLINASLKTMAQANVHKIDSVLSLFTDEKGNILVDIFINNFTDGLIENGKIEIDIKKYARELNINPLLYNLIPNKVLYITNDEITELKNLFR